MKNDRIEECFNSAKKIVFDSSWNQSKSPPIVVVVYDKFTSLVKNAASALKLINEKNRCIILFDAYQENLLSFSFINKDADEILDSSYFSYAPDEFKKFYDAQSFHNKIIFTFYESSENNETRLLQLKDFPFFLYLETKFILPEGRSIYKNGIYIS